MGNTGKMGNPKVVELGGNVSAAYTAKLLADMGAEVIKLELPAGDPLRQHQQANHGSGTSDSGMSDSSYFQAINLNKDSVIVDYETDPQALVPWLNWADVLVHDLSAAASKAIGLDCASITVSNPTLVVTAITPFGHTGPYAGYQANELILSNAGGWANLCPATHEDPDLPPLKVYGDHCQMMAAVSAAATTLACFRQSRASGVGEYVDFSVQSYVASVLEAGLPAFAYKEEVVNRSHLRSLIPWRIFQAQDAPVFMVCVEQDQWQRLVQFMGNPEWASLPTFADQPARHENQDLVHTLIQEFVSKWRALDLYHAAQAQRICVAPVFDLAQLAENEHLHARNFFTKPNGNNPMLMHAAVLGTSGRAAIKKLAPALGNLSSTAVLAAGVNKPGNSPVSAPLHGIRVLDMTWAWAGPFCSLNLAHLGAEVIRIESASRPDLYRRLPLFPVGIEEGLNCSGMFNQWNQGKASVTVNLGHAEGIDIVKSLVAESDVVVQNFATGVLHRLGLGYDVLQAINPGIILASISGYGQTGPYREYMGYGPAIPPLTGISAATGYLGGEAEEIGLSMPDPTAGITAAYGVIAALIKRDVSGHGDHLDISLWEATAVLNAEGWMGFSTAGQQPTRLGNRSTNMAPHGVFRCAGEDRWVAIACRTEAEWQTLADHLGILDERFATHELRQQHVDALEAVITQWTTMKDRWDITTELQNLGIPAFPSLTTEDVANDVHLNQREFIVHLAHPEVGKRAHAGIPWRLAHRPSRVAAPAPCIDADTDRYLAELGKSPSEISALRQRGIVGC